MNSRDLTDEQCWAIWMTLDPDLRDLSHLPPSDADEYTLGVNLVRKWLGPGSPIAALRAIVRYLTLAEEHSLAQRVDSLRRERQALN
jgi:hypothetical protein